MLNTKRKFATVTVYALIFTVNSFAQKINQFDANGKRTGIWKKYYENNKVRYIGKFKNGKEVGTFKFFDDSSLRIPAIVKEFSAKSDSAFVKFFNSKGTIKSKGWMIGKNRIGKWMYYYNERSIFSEEEYEAGKLDGIVKNYYPNGNLTEESQYAKGKKEGLSKIYTNSGTLIEEINYTAGSLNGLAKYYDLKGNLKEKGNYVKGIREGKWEFYMDGELVDKKKRKKISDYKNE